MKVKELIAALRSCPEESDVILQKDAEGNGFSPLTQVDDECIYRADSTWGGTVYCTEWSAYDADMEEEDWEQLKRDKPACVVLVPVN